MTKLINNEKALVELYELKDDFMHQSKMIIENYIRTYMLANNVWGIAWTQYTPYFNDGEDCIFSVNDPYELPQTLPDEDKEKFAMSDNVNVYALDDYGVWGTEICEFISQLPQDVMKFIFNDHSFVVIYMNKHNILQTRISFMEHE